jgi:hypothetical protein
VLVGFFKLCSAEPAVISSFPLFPLLTGESTVIGFTFTLLAEVLRTLVASYSLSCVVSSSLLGHGLTIIVLHIKINLAWLNRHLVFACCVRANDELEHVLDNFLVEISH